VNAKGGMLKWGEGRREEKRTSNIQHSTTNFQGKKRMGQMGRMRPMWEAEENVQ
jgi:hypothetical protein